MPNARVFILSSYLLLCVGQDLSFSLVDAGFCLLPYEVKSSRHLAHSFLAFVGTPSPLVVLCLQCTLVGRRLGATQYVPTTQTKACTYLYVRCQAVQVETNMNSGL